MEQNGNAFEAARAARVAANQQRMRELGVTSLIPAPAPSAAPRKRPRKRPRRAPAAGGRRSSRLAGAAVEYGELSGEASEPEDVSGMRRSARRRGLAPAASPGTAVTHPAASDGAAAALPRGSESAAAAVPATGVPANSVRALVANVAAMQAACLGHRVLPTDGSGAMKLAALQKLCGSPGKDIRFNKYAGIQEFSNCVALFVNVSGSKIYTNVWMDGGRRMTWFAAPSSTEATPVVRRILASSSSAAAAAPVLLFCREEGRPYVYCGRLKAEECFPSAQPALKVVFSLVDFAVVAAGAGFRELGVGKT